MCSQRGVQGVAVLVVVFLLCCASSSELWWRKPGGGGPLATAAAAAVGAELHLTGVSRHDLGRQARVLARSRLEGSRESLEGTSASDHQRPCCRPHYRIASVYAGGEDVHMTACVFRLHLFLHHLSSCRQKSSGWSDKAGVLQSLADEGLDLRQAASRRRVGRLGRAAPAPSLQENEKGNGSQEPNGERRMDEG